MAKQVHSPVERRWRKKKLIHMESDAGMNLKLYHGVRFHCFPWKKHTALLRNFLEHWNQNFLRICIFWFLFSSFSFFFLFVTMENVYMPLNVLANEELIDFESILLQFLFSFYTFVLFLNFWKVAKKNKSRKTTSANSSFVKARLRLIQHFFKILSHALWSHCYRFSIATSI